MAVSEKNTRVQVTLRKQTMKKLEECADWQGLKKSQIIESAIVQYLESKGLYSEEERLMYL